MLEYLKFHHIGYVVNDISTTAVYYTNVGWQLSRITFDPIQRSNVAFLSREGFPLIELIAPADETSPVIKILEKSGVSTYHVCYEVEDIEKAVIELRKQKFIPIFKPVAALALGNSKICYLYNKSVGLIEIVNKKEEV